MLFYSSASRRTTFTTVLASFAQADGSTLPNALDEPTIQQACDRFDVAFGTGPDDVYTPAVTLWALLSQCLNASKSCAAAVARVLALRVALGLPPCSANNGAYCKARAKLPVPLIRHLALEVGRRLEDQAPAAWRAKGKRVFLVDGATLSGPDTLANQKAFPQSRSQKKGLGFPLIRMVVLLGFATAGLVGAELGPWAGKETGETALLRSMLDRLRRGDVLVADRYYCSYWMVALCLAAGIDVCFRLHQRRRYDMSKGQVLGPNDHVVPWVKPARPAWMNEATYASLPDTLTIREVRQRVTRKGFRVREIVVATTLLDHQAHTAEDIADLYHYRWHVELDIRVIKQTLKMDILRGKTPEMLRREVWAHLLTYNLVRQAMAQAAAEHGLLPRQLSFAGAQQQLDASREGLSQAEGAELTRRARVLSGAIVQRRVADRPDRCEPRKVKRRPKDAKLLSRPRAEERAALLAE